MKAGLSLDGLLEKTSRTFALSIPLLPEPERLEVGVAYLLFRIADTFEDGALWPPERRQQALADFERMLVEPSEASRLAREWVSSPPIAHEGYVELLEATPEVLRVEAWQATWHERASPAGSNSRTFATSGAIATSWRGSSARC